MCGEDALCQMAPVCSPFFIPSTVWHLNHITVLMFLRLLTTQFRASEGETTIIKSGSYGEPHSSQSVNTMWRRTMNEVTDIVGGKCPQGLSRSSRRRREISFMLYELHVMLHGRQDNIWKHASFVEASRRALVMLMSKYDNTRGWVNWGVRLQETQLVIDLRHHSIGTWFYRA